MKSFTQYLCLLSLIILAISSCSSGHILDSLRLDELYYPASDEYPVSTLPNGDSESLVWHLENPISFYGEKYDKFYVSSIIFFYEIFFSLV